MKAKLLVLTLAMMVFPLATYSIAAQNTSHSAVYSKRVIENGTAITLTIGNVVLPATLNNSRTSQELISRLPYTVRLHRYSHDYCGVMKEPLPYDEADVHNGWLDGDIDFARDADYFTILFEDGDNSEQYGHQITMGKLDGDLNEIKNLGSDIEILIELAK